MQKLAPMLPGHAKLLDEYQLLSGRYRGGDMAAHVLFSPWRFDDEDVSLSPKGPLSAQGEIRITRFISSRATRARGGGSLYSAIRLPSG
jgi:hypothetical protein